MIYLITGRKGAGKTTLGKSLTVTIKGQNTPVGILLDGDEVRSLWKNDFTMEGRKSHLENIAKMAKLINSQGMDVVIAAIMPTKELRKMIIDICGYDNCEMIYILGGELWEGTSYEEPSYDECRKLTVYNR